jgi:hypothetical protein
VHLAQTSKITMAEIENAEKEEKAKTSTASKE